MITVIVDPAGNEVALEEATPELLRWALRDLSRKAEAGLLPTACRYCGHVASRHSDEDCPARSRLKVFQVHYDGEQELVEAVSFGAAVEKWKEHLLAENDNDLELLDEEPESVVLLSTDPVIR